MNKATTEPAYHYKVVRQFAIMTVVWGVIGMGLGVLIASQLVWPQMNFDLPWTMAQGGPARATTTLSIEVYTTAFKNWNMGKAATIGTIWAVLLACFSFIYLRRVNESE